MANENFKNKFRIPSARAAWHNYNAGTYFVTICTANRKHFFGKIITDDNGEPKMALSEIGEYVDECIQKIPQHNQYATIPLYVVMPNHIHMVVIIKNDDCRDVPGAYHHRRDVPWRVSTDGKNETMQSIANKQGRLSTTIGGLKQSVTRFANNHNIPFAWQPRFHDRIVRNTDELNRIARYIQNNVARWESDK